MRQSLRQVTCTPRKHVGPHKPGIRCKCGKARFCNQCWRYVALSRFGDAEKNCRGCRKRGGPRKPREPSHEPLRVTFVRCSRNRKLGPIPSSMSSKSTCPPSCSFFGAGCFAEFGKTNAHWNRVPKDGLSWDAFCNQIATLPPGTLWRHNTAGDLPGIGIHLEARKLMALVDANRGRRGFTFTHKTSSVGIIRDRVIYWIDKANREGFTVNASADNLDEADELAAAGLPVAVVLPVQRLSGRANWLPLRTPQGRTVVRCPAETSGLTCARCKLCANPNRKSIVGFEAHGQSKARVSQIVQLRRK